VLEGDGRAFEEIRRERLAADGSGERCGG
jgi:hypothetical protein